MSTTPAQQLKQLITQRISGCNNLLHPTICGLTATASGRKKIEEEIFTRCIETGKSVGQVINEIEYEYNPNINPE